MRQRTDYLALPLADIAERYAAGESARSLAAEFGARDHKTLIKHIRPLVEAAGGEMRDQKKSQKARREWEFKKEDVWNLWDGSLGHVTGPQHRATRL